MDSEPFIIACSSILLLFLFNNLVYKVHPSSPMASDMYNYRKYSSYWTTRQNKLFENALALYDEDTPNRWEKIAKAVADKSAEEVKRHYEILVQDLIDIENGFIPIPNYKSTPSDSDVELEADRHNDFMNGNDTTACEDRLPELVRWLPPLPGCIKLNTNGCCIGLHGKAGFGGTLRDHDGAWIAGFCGSVGIAPILFAKLMAIYQGLDLAWNRGYRTVLCESDSHEALRIILEAKECFHLFGAIIAKIRSQLAQNWSVQLQVFIEANHCVDSLAKKGAMGSDEMQILNDSPADLICPLQADALDSTSSTF